MTALMTNAHSLSRFFQTDSRALRRPLFFFLKSLWMDFSASDASDQQ
jgi:hypothetical protein